MSAVQPGGRTPRQETFDAKWLKKDHPGKKAIGKAQAIKEWFSKGQDFIKVKVLDKYDKISMTRKIKSELKNVDSEIGEITLAIANHESKKMIESRSNQIGKKLNEISTKIQNLGTIEKNKIIMKRFQDDHIAISFKIYQLKGLLNWFI